MDNGPDLAAVRELDGRHIMGTYKREDVCFVRGRGALLWDTGGNEYLDMVGGLAVCGLGHCHPAVVRALRRQAGELLHTSNLYYIRRQAELAARLAPLLPAGLEKLFFCNSGTEAVEGALKLAVLATGRRGIIAAWNSFHGRTAAALAATGQEKYRKGLDGLLPGSVTFVKYGDAAELAERLGPETAAVILEPIQGEGGVVVPPDGYLREARRLCDASGALLIFDEVQTGMGRTGRMFGCQHEGVSPDIMTMAKALGGGVPIGAIAATPDVAESFEPGAHGSTFGGNPLACAAACAVVDEMVSKGLAASAEKKGRTLRKMVLAVQQRHPGVMGEIRGRGLMAGIEMGQERAGAFKAFALSRRVLVNVAAGSVVRLLPPLVVTRGQLARFAEVLDEFCRLQAPPEQSVNDRPAAPPP